MNVSLHKFFFFLNQITDNYDEESLEFERDGQIWFRPGCIDDLLKIINEHPKAKLIAGNTDIGNNPVFVYMDENDC